MSKFCKNCGASLEDNTKFCSNCGTEVSACEDAPVQENVEAPAAEGAAPAKRKLSFNIEDIKAYFSNIDKPKAIKLGSIAAAVVVAIVAIIVAISLIFPGPEAVVKKALNAAIDGNAKAFVSVVPPFLFEDKDEKEDAIDSLDDALDDAEIDDIEFEIKKVTKMSSSDKKSLKEDLEDTEDYLDDFDADDVTDFKTVKVRIDDGDDKHTIDIDVIKYKGRWYIWDFTSLLYYIQ